MQIAYSLLTCEAAGLRTAILATAWLLVIFGSIYQVVFTVFTAGNGYLFYLFLLLLKITLFNAVQNVVSFNSSHFHFVEQLKRLNPIV